MKNFHLDQVAICARGEIKFSSGIYPGVVLQSQHAKYNQISFHSWDI